MSHTPPPREHSSQKYNLHGFIAHFGDTTPHNPRFDVQTATASTLRKDLVSHNLTSVHLVEEYQRQISVHNGYLNAVYELAPGAIERAEAMDMLRSQGTVLSSLYGIPILLKACSFHLHASEARQI